MGLIQDMSKKGRSGAKLPVPTTAGDDQVIAAKTGEYVLPPEVVAAIGLDKLNALVQSITGQPPGGEPAEMPQMDGHPMMGEQMMGHANGGIISKFSATSKFSASPLNSDPLQDNRESLRKYGFDGGMGSDSVATEISRAAKGMPMADEVMEAGMDKMAQKSMQPQRKRMGISDLRDLEAMGALGEDSNIMGFNKGGLIARMKGYAEGGIVEDDYTRRKLSGYNPHQSIPKNATTNASPRAPELRNYAPEPGRLQSQPANTYTRMGTEPNAARAPELRNFTPEPGRVQPGATTPRITGLAAEPAAAPRGTPSRTVAELDARASSPNTSAAKRGVQQVQAQRATAEAMNPGKGTIRGLAGAAVIPAMEVTQQFVTGGDADMRNQFYNDPNVGTLEKAKQFGRDAAGIVLPSAGAVVGGGVGSVFAPVAGTAAGGIAGYGVGKAADAGLQAALGESALDRYKAAQPQQVAQAPQMDPKAQSDEIARRRAALAPQPSFEQKIGKFIADERATPASVAAAPKPAARGPVSGLAARAAKAAPAQPAAPQIDPAVMADAQAAQAELDQSPIARIVGGTGGTMTIQYKDGTTKQVGREGMDEVNGFYALTSRAAKQYDAQPVEIIAGNAGRSQAMPELGYQVVPDAIARTGKSGDYVQGLAQAAMDRADPLAAEQRLMKTKTDEQIRASNATDRDGEGRGLRTEAARLDLEQRKREQALLERALAGDAQAIQQIQQLRTLQGQGGDNMRMKIIPDLAKAYSSGVTPPVGPDGKTPLTPQQYVDQWLGAGTVQSNSAPPPQKGAVVKGYRFNGGDPGDRANWSKVQ